MPSFILIAEAGPHDDPTVYETDTKEQCEAAAKALTAAGLLEARVLVGDPEGDHYENGQVLWAR